MQENLEQTENHPEQEDPSELQPASGQESAFFRGTVSRVTFHSNETGFAVLRVEPDAGMQDTESMDQGLATVVGEIPSSLGVGSGIIARGRVVKSPYSDTHWENARADAGETADFIDVEFEDIRDPKQDAFVSHATLTSTTAIPRAPATRRRARR